MPLSQPGGSGIADQGVVTYFDFTTAAAPAAPAAGKVRVYSKTSDHLTQRVNGGTETALDSAGGGSAQFDEDGSIYRLKPTFDTLAQEDPLDGSEASVVMATGDIVATATDGSKSASIELEGSSGDVTITAAGNSASDVEVLADGAFVVSVTGRIIMVGGQGVEFPELAADPTPTGGNTIYFNNVSFKHRAWDGTAWQDLATAGGSALTVKDEGSSLATDATSLDFVGAGVTASGAGAAKTITIPGGGGSYIDSTALDGTYGTEFNEASLPGGRTRPSGLVVGDETYQSGGGSFLRVAIASTGGAADKAYYQSAAPAGDCEIVLSLGYFSVSESDMVGPGIADSSGNGVAAIIYQGSLRTIAIASGHYSSLQGTLSLLGKVAEGSPLFIKLRRSGNNWYASISTDGYNFGLETGAYSSAVSAGRLYYGCYWSTEAGVMCLGRNNKVA